MIDQLEKYLFEQSKLAESEKAKWRKFFENVPASADDIQKDKCFKWSLPELASKFQAARAISGHQGSVTELEPRPDYMFEKIT